MANFLKIENKESWGIFNVDKIFNISPSQYQWGKEINYSINIFSDAINCKNIPFESKKERDTALNAMYKQFGNFSLDKNNMTRKDTEFTNTSKISSDNYNTEHSDKKM